MYFDSSWQEKKKPGRSTGRPGFILDLSNTDLNPLYYLAIEFFEEATGVPVLLNTSLNLRGEPIFLTPLNALNMFGKSDIDTLYVDGFIVKKLQVRGKAYVLGRNNWII